MVFRTNCALRKSTGAKLPIGHGYSNVQSGIRRNNNDFILQISTIIITIKRENIQNAQVRIHAIMYRIIASFLITLPMRIIVYFKSDEKKNALLLYIILYFICIQCSSNRPAGIIHNKNDNDGK